MKDTREVVILNLDDILPNRFQPRIKFDEKAIVELSESIKEHGVIQPIIVRKISDKFEIIAGERRYKASVMAGKTTIPAIVVDLDDKDSSEIALIENVQRQDLTPIEEAISYRKILDMGYLTQEELANKLGVAQPTVANKLRLLNLDDEVQDALLDEKISERHARSLLKLDKDSMQREMLNRIINERLTVRKTDEEIDKMINGKNDNISTFDSIENNMNQNLNNISENSFNPNIVPETNEQVDLGNNPFIINNDISTGVTDNMVNEEPINVVPESVEVLDFNDFGNDNNSVNEIPQNINNFPSMPIVEDAPVIENNVEEMPNNDVVMESPMVNQYEEPINEVENNINEIQPESIPSEVVPETLNQNNAEEVNVVNEVNNENEDDGGSELRPGRFFNILNNDIDEQEKVEQETLKVVEETPLLNNLDNNEPDINVSNNVFNPQFINPFKQNLNPVNDVEEPKAEEVQNFNYNVPPVTPVYEDTMPEPIVPNTFNVDSGMTLRDAINMVRDCADKIEKNNLEIDCEEFDFDDMYQIIFKIKK